MSFLLDDTAAHEAVKDSNPLRMAQDAHNVRLRVDLSRVSRKELEDNFLQLHDDSLLLKQHIHQQEDKIRKLGTKLLRLVKDRRRMEQLAGDGAPPASGRRDAEKDDLMDEFQEKVRALEADNERLKQRLFVAKRQQRPVCSAARSPLVRGQTRVATAPAPGKHDDASSPSLTPPRRARSSAGDERPPQALLEEARERTRNLENVIESQQRRIAQLEEEKHVTLQQQNKSELRSQINNNVTMIKLQKQLAERCAATMELEERFLQLQESHNTQKACYDAAAAKMAELISQLRDERAKGVELRTQLQTAQLAHAKTQQLQERLDEVEQEKALLKEHNEKLLNSMFDGPQRWSAQEQRLQQHIAHLEEALQADLQDKKTILEQVKVEKDAREKLTEEKGQLEDQLAQQKRETDELRRRLDVYCGADGYDGEKLAEALLLVKARNSQPGGESSSRQELRDQHQDAHVETVEELEKVRRLLTLESRISSDLKAELDSVQKKMESDKKSHAQQLERQLQVLVAKDSKMHKLEAQLRDVAYGVKNVGVAGNAADENQSPPLERGENLVEVQIVGASLSEAALEALGDPAPSTFCTYAFYLFELHSTPVATGPAPRYGFTSRYAVSVDRDFLEYVGKRQLRVEMHQALGLRWKTVASAAMDLRRLLRDGAAAGTLPLLGSSGGDPCFGSVDYWIKLRHPVGEPERLAATGGRDDQQRHEKELLVEVRGCGGLRSRCSSLPSSYVVYKFFHFPDHPTSTVPDCRRPRFADVRSFSVTADSALERYLRSEALSFYVFDFKEPQMDAYLGKAAVPLAPLLRDRHVAGTFDLHDSAGRHVGQIDVALKWKFPVLQSASALEQEEDVPGSPSESRVATPAPKKDQRKDELVPKKVTFKEAPPPEPQAAPAKPEEDEDDEESLISEGQLLLPHPTLTSDPQRHLPHDGGQAESSRRQSEADVARVGPVSAPPPESRVSCAQESWQVRVEVTSLSLEAESRLRRDVDVVRLFVEFAFLDLPTEETPVSLPKPPPGESVSFDFSKVFPVDTAGGASRRQLLKDVLRGRKADMQRICFTVVSEPPEEEEQERECEDVGVAYLNIPDLLKQPHDVAHLHLPVVDVEDGVSLLGALRVTFEGVQTLRALLDEADGDISVTSAVV